MVSLNDRLVLTSLIQVDSHLNRFQLLLDGNYVPRAQSNGLHAELLDAIADRNAARFTQIATGIGQRKISADADWCNDDYLIFLLILGNELFDRPLSFLSRVFAVRAANPNPLPRQINQVFSALERQEFDLTGELSFLKLPFLRVTGKLALAAGDAQKALKDMSSPEVFGQMTPFMKLLTLKAYDIVLTERQQFQAETTADLVKAIEAHAKDLSLRQIGAIAAALPGRMVVAVVAAITFAGAIPFLYGWGKAFYEASHQEANLIRPTNINARSVGELGDLPREAALTVRGMQLELPAKSARTALVRIDTEPFKTATPSFVIEASHAERPIVNAVAFTWTPADQLQPFSVVAIQRDGGRVRAMLPRQSSGQAVLLVLEFEAQPNDTSASLGKRVILRPLE